MVWKIVRVFGIVILSLVGLVLIFLAVGIAPLDREPVQQKPAYKTMLQRLDSLHLSIKPAQHGFAVGYAKVNLTPSQPVALAGYGNRMGKSYVSVRDSIYVRALVVDNGAQRVAIVSADLLIIPPTVSERLSKELPDIDFTINNTFLGATHSHNSIGNWGKGATEWMYGAYEDSTVQFITDKIKRCLVQASLNVRPAVIKTGTVPVSKAVRNRLDKENGTIDSLLRVVEVHRDDSSKLLLMSYTAHATCLFSRDLVLSRDYPGQLVDEMEAAGFTFAMFMAGAVGSHGCHPPEYGEPCIDWMAEQVRTEFFQHRDNLHVMRDSALAMVRVPLELPPSRAKIAENWRLRPWLFRAAFGEYPVYLTALRVGDLILLGTPCDFSGELTAPLDSLATSLHREAMVTSFNGGYIGYITADRYYERDHYETRLMSWYGPGNGAYVSECLTRLIVAVK